MIIGRRFAPPEKYMVKCISVEVELPAKLNASLMDGPVYQAVVIVIINIEESCQADNYRDCHRYRLLATSHVRTCARTVLRPSVYCTGTTNETKQNNIEASQRFAKVRKKRTVEGVTLDTPVFCMIVC